MMYDVDTITNWSATLAKTIEELGSDKFVGALLKAIGFLVPFDCALILSYSSKQRPVVLYDQFEHPLRGNRLDNYLKGAYLLDPFFLAAMTRERPILLRMRELAPRDFEQSDYFINYYRRSNIADELNYLVPVGPDTCLALSLERAANSERFSEDQTKYLKGIVELVAALLRNHQRLYRTEKELNVADPEHEKLVKRLEGLGEHVLTNRERQVTQLILKGCSSLSVATRLGVAIETVKVHRRNIYRKLSISSLAELHSFALKELLGEIKE